MTIRKLHARNVKVSEHLHSNRKESETDECVLVCTNRIAKHPDSPFTTVECGHRMSPRTHSWFSQTKLSVFEVVLYTCMWYDKLSNAYIESILHFSPTTTTDWASFCREAAIDMAIDHSKPIGGPGKIVEIDECKASKSKCLVFFVSLP